MTPLRISTGTSSAFDNITAKVARLRTTLGPGFTTTMAMQGADSTLAAMVSEIKALRILVRGDIANAKTREREDRSTRKVG